MHFQKLPPKIINYKDSKIFDNERFMNSLQYTNVDYNKNPDKCYEIVIAFLIITHQEIRNILVEIMTGRV